MRSLDDATVITAADIDRIVTICNQFSVYNMLFAERLQGAPYVKEDARRFVAWAREGWRTQGWFVFLVRDARDEIIGALDIKSNTLDRAEIGYWGDIHSSGFMTNAVAALCDIARSVGYRALFATTKPNNERSQAVLARNGFQPDGKVTKPDGIHPIFVLTLTPARKSA